MVAKLALVLLVLALVLSVSIGLVFWYFNQKDERKHEKEMERMERDKQLFSGDDDLIDRELEQEKKK